jgi:beta-lactamase class A
MVRHFLLLTFLAASAASAENNPVSRIAAIETRTGGRIGVATLDTSNDKHLDYRPEERFPMCSTFKFLAAAAVLKRVDEKKEKLERFVPYNAKDILEYAPVTKEHLKEGGMTLGALCEAAIEQSDNTAGNLLLNAIGGPPGLTNFVRTLGDRVTRLDRIEPELNSAIPGDERDTTTPAAISSDMQRLLLGDSLSEASRRQLDDWLQRNETGGPMIRAGVPKTWSVGDKTGRGSNGATNDIAIMRPPGRAPILLAIYSVGSTATANDRAAAIAEVTKVVAESLKETAKDAQNSTPEFRRCAIRRARSVCVMKTSTPKTFASSAFRIVPLLTEVAEEARRTAQSGAEDHAIIKVDSATGYPCRHCLRWAQPGERVILFPYASIPPGHPYSETGPIFVHAERCERYSATGEYPVDFRNARVFRAYDANYNMIDAEVANGNDPEAVIEKLLENPKTEFVDARSVTRGCFTFRILRV